MTAWVSRCALVFAGLLGGCAEASEDVKLRAANDFGCTEPITVTSIGGGAYQADGCSQRRIYDCQASESYRGTTTGYSCHPEQGTDSAVESGPSRLPKSDGPRPSDLQAAAPSQLKEPPSGAGGFTFGAVEEDARHTCEQARHMYTPDTAGHATCDGLAADIGSPARAALTYCAGKICAVSLKVDLAPRESLSQALVRWKAALTDRYGGASSTTANIPTECKDDVTPCLLSRTASVRFDWNWPTREHVSLTPQVDETQKIAWINISYMAAELAKPRAPGL